MSDEPTHDAVRRVLRLLRERLESYLEGDDLAFETLGEAIEQERVTPDELNATLMVLQSVIDPSDEWTDATVTHTAGKHAQRVWSVEERESLTPESWGLLLDLKRRGSLDDEQFERVLDVLTTIMARPVGIDVAREVAARVALSAGTMDAIAEDERGEHELAH